MLYLRSVGGLRRAARAARSRRLGRRRRRRLDRLPRSPRPRVSAVWRSPCSTRRRSRSSACSAPRWAPSTATSIAITGCGCCRDRRRGVRGRGPLSSACARATATRSTATSSSSASACSPRIELAERAGIAVGNGILVDERLQTSAPGVFAAGDVANAHHPFYGERDPRRALGQRARPGAGRRAEHARPRGSRTTALPYFFSDQYDAGMEYTGLRARRGTASSFAAIPRAASSSPSG